MTFLAGDALSFAPNWADGLVERWQYDTEVFRGRDGTEERRQNDNAPRLSLSASYLLTAAEAATLREILWRKAWYKFWLPYWPLATPLTAIATATATTIAVNTTDLPWKVGAGALLTDGSGWRSEASEIEIVGGAALTLVDALAHTWGNRQWACPAGRGFLQNEFSSEFRQLTADVMQTQLDWVYDPSNNPIDFPLGTAAATYRGSELWLWEPNWVSEIGIQIDHRSRLVDAGRGTFGVPDYDQSTSRMAMQTSGGAWFLKGLSQAAEFRKFCARRRGMLNGFWTPSWMTDFSPLSTIGAAATTLSVKRTDAGAPVPGRRDIIIFLKNGTRFARRLSNIVDNGDGTQTLTIDSALGQEVTVAQVQRICWLHWSRLGSDTIEFRWESPLYAEGRLSVAHIREG